MDGGEQAPVLDALGAPLGRPARAQARQRSDGERERDEDIVGELKAVRLQAIREQAIALYMQGKEAEADELLKKAGLELEDWMRDAQNLSPRQRARMFGASSEFSSFALMGDINEKRKRLYESRNRVDRDRDNFRNKP